MYIKLKALQSFYSYLLTPLFSTILFFPLHVFDLNYEQRDSGVYYYTPQQYTPSVQKYNYANNSNTATVAANAAVSSRSQSTNSLSSAAAAAVMKNKNGRQEKQQVSFPGSYKPTSRSMSLTSASNSPRQLSARSFRSPAEISSRRTNSLQSNASNNFRYQQKLQPGGLNKVENPQSRSNSLTSGAVRTAANGSRSNSLQSNSSRRSNLATTTTTTTTTTTKSTRPDGKPSTKIVKTVTEQDSNGRTKSITKTTIQKLGSYEMVKTTVIKPQESQYEESPTYAESLLSGTNDLEDIVEEFDENFDEAFEAGDENLYEEPIIEEAEDEDYETEINDDNVTGFHRDREIVTPHVQRQEIQEQHHIQQLTPKITQKEVNRPNSQLEPKKSILKKSSSASPPVKNVVSMSPRKEQSTSPQSPLSSSFTSLNENKDQFDDKIDHALIGAQSHSHYVPLKDNQLPVNTSSSVPELNSQSQTLASPIKTRNQSATHGRSSSVQSNASSQRLHSYRTLSHIQQQTPRKFLEHSPTKVKTQPRTKQTEDVTSSTIEDEALHAVVDNSNKVQLTNENKFSKPIMDHVMKSSEFSSDDLSLSSYSDAVQEPDNDLSMKTKEDDQDVTQNQIDELKDNTVTVNGNDSEKVTEKVFVSSPDNNTLSQPQFQPPTQNIHTIQKPSVSSNGRTSSFTSNNSSVKKSIKFQEIPTEYNAPPSAEPKRKEVTPEEMYARAFEIAQAKIYGTQQHQQPQFQNKLQYPQADHQTQPLSPQVPQYSYISNARLETYIPPQIIPYDDEEDPYVDADTHMNTLLNSGVSTERAMSLTSKNSKTSRTSQNKFLSMSGAFSSPVPPNKLPSANGSYNYQSNASGVPFRTHSLREIPSTQESRKLDKATQKEREKENKKYKKELEKQKKLERKNFNKEGEAEIERLTSQLAEKAKIEHERQILEQEQLAEKNRHVLLKAQQQAQISANEKVQQIYAQQNLLSIHDQRHTIQSSQPDPLSHEQSQHQLQQETSSPVKSYIQPVQKQRTNSISSIAKKRTSFFSFRKHKSKSKDETDGAVLDIRSAQSQNEPQQEGLGNSLTGYNSGYKDDNIKESSSINNGPVPIISANPLQYTNSLSKSQIASSQSINPSVQSIYSTSRPSQKEYIGSTNSKLNTPIGTSSQQYIHPAAAKNLETESSPQLEPVRPLVDKTNPSELSQSTNGSPSTPINSATSKVSTGENYQNRLTKTPSSQGSQISRGQSIKKYRVSQISLEKILPQENVKGEGSGKTTKEGMNTTGKKAKKANHMTVHLPGEEDELSENDHLEDDDENATVVVVNEHTARAPDSTTQLPIQNNSGSFYSDVPSRTANSENASDFFMNSTPHPSIQGYNNDTAHYEVKNTISAPMQKFEGMDALQLQQNMINQNSQYKSTENGQQVLQKDNNPIQTVVNQPAQSQETKNNKHSQSKNKPNVGRKLMKLFNL